MAHKPRTPSPKMEAIAAYRNRFRRWTMETMPNMPTEQWARLIQWVNDFGGVTGPVTGAERRRKWRHNPRLVAFNTGASNNEPTDPAANK